MAVGRASVIGANLKFNQALRNITGLAVYLNELGRFLEAGNKHRTEVRVYPHDFVLTRMGFTGSLFKPSPVEIGAQDIHSTEDGSFTGASLSAQDVHSLGVHVQHTLIGHSETRAYLGVTDKDVAKKLEAALKANLFATVCLGEDIADKQAGKTGEVIERQIVEGLLPAIKADEVKFEIAYEPVYAIAGFAQALGLKAIPPEMRDIQFAHETIRGILAKAGFTQIADHVRILYGGSAKPENTRELLSQPYIDGLLVGTASWDVQNFIRMIEIAEAVSQPQAE